jgi:hypothetical protein
LPPAIITDVPPADIIAPKYENVWFFGFRHFGLRRLNAVLGECCGPYCPG